MAGSTSVKLLSVALEGPASEAIVERAGVKVFTTECLALCRLRASRVMWPMRQWAGDSYPQVRCGSPMSGGRVQTWSRDQMELDLSLGCPHTSTQNDLQ